MQLLLLHLDDALELQPDFVRACTQAGAHQISDEESGRAIRLWSKWGALDKLACALDRRTPAVGKEAPLWFLGSGDFHHVSALLLERALARHPAPTTLIHFDNHPDWVRFEDGMHCGSWINRALDNQNVRKVITLGVCSDDLCSPERKGGNLKLLSEGRLELYPYAHPPSRVAADYGCGASHRQDAGALHWRSIANLGEQNFIGWFLDRIETEAVYVTIDKDVLAPEDAVTNWDQGRMRLPYVLTLISEIGRRCRIVGADVTGDYSAPRYGGNLWTRVAKKAEVLIDQPRKRPELAAVRHINSAANHALLDVLAEAMG
ncbi:hypothetical protein [Rhizobium sp. Root1220]|uniref:hypothetical protein n=1 Tax=Rhizobium sp. Root1220 TaxID=1736432 RepID=UPI0006F1D130|nr:hypothetical protein [Rhizobium sp. Root1220]KQV65196.1 arginase [Rhizobium sp. Root1220]